MDKESTELSRLGLKAFSRELSPEYERIRTKLLGLLAVQGSTVEQLAQKDKNDRANVALLFDFVNVLPRAVLKKRLWLNPENMYYEFTTDDPYEARAIQSNVIWGNRVGSHVDEDPYYVVGKHIQGRKTFLLLARAGLGDVKLNNTKPPQPTLSVLSMPKRYAKKLTNLDRVAASEYPTPTDISSMFSLERHTLIIDRFSPASTSLTDPDFFIFTPPVDFTIIDRISDENLAQFDAISHVQRIATIFGVQPQLDELLLSHQNR